MGLLKTRRDEPLGHAEHAAKAEAILSQSTSMARGGIEVRQRDLMAANAHATLALYELLKERAEVPPR